MRRFRRPVLMAMAAAFLAASVFPTAIPRSGDECAPCHGNYQQYLDILEGDPGNRLPISIENGQILNVTVVVKNICNAGKYNTISSVSASLASVKGLFWTLSNPVSLGSLGAGQTRKATWQIVPVAPGNDILRITARGINVHEGCHFNDSYSPDPYITVGAPAVDAAPSVFLESHIPGSRATGGSGLMVGWTVSDEDRASCIVDLYYSTDGFAVVNNTIATGLQSDRPFDWTLPVIDSGTVMLKAIVADSGGNRNETVMTGTFSIDSTPPSVLSVEPQNRGSNVTDQAFIVITFSEPVREDTARSAFRIEPDPGGQSWIWDPDGATLMIAHSPFSAGTGYSCSFSPGVLDRSVPGNRDALGHNWSFITSDTFFPTPSVAIFSPQNDDQYYQGEMITVDWTATGGTGPLAINISLSENGSQGPFDPVALRLANSGAFSFTAPDIVSERCALEVAVYDGNGTESRALSGLFAISPRLALDAAYPPAEAVLVANRTLAISWNATGGHKAVSVRLQFQRDRNTPSQAVASKLPRSGSYRWTVPAVDTASARLIVNATDGWNRSLERISDEFTIVSVDPDLPPPPVPPPDRPPVVVFNIRENDVRAGRNVTFDASASFDPERDSMHFVWDFGDGSPLQNTTAPIVSHRFQEKGHFRVRLTVAGPHGESSQAIEVEASGPFATASDGGREQALIWLGIMVMVLGSAGVSLEALRSKGGR